MQIDSSIELYLQSLWCSSDSNNCFRNKNL